MSIRLIALSFLVAAALPLAGCGDDGDEGSDGAPSDPPAATEVSDEDEDTENESTGGGDLSETEVCSLLSSEEVEAAVGNDVEDGREDFGISCVWDSIPEETSVSVYIQPVLTGEQCEQALSTDTLYAEADGFGAAAFTSYNEVSGGQSDVVVCLENGQLQLIVTGGIGAEAVEAELRQAAEDLTMLVLSRL